MFAVHNATHWKAWKPGNPHQNYSIRALHGLGDETLAVSSTSYPPACKSARSGYLRSACSSRCRIQALRNRDPLNGEVSRGYTSSRYLPLLRNNARLSQPQDGSFVQPGQAGRCGIEISLCLAHSQELLEITYKGRGNHLPSHSFRISYHAEMPLWSSHGD